MIRVLVAEDSLTVRELLVAILGSDPEIEVVGQAKDGAEAVELAKRLRPDVITMDIEMPALDGLEATKEIMVHAPAPIIIVTASASRPHTQRSFDALRAGALMLLDKPEDPGSSRFDGRRERFVEMVKAMAGVKVVRRWAPRSARPQPPSQRAASGAVAVIVVAASTGGPAALQRLLTALPRAFPVPLLVVQHIAEGFVANLADWLAAACNLRVKVAEAGETLMPRTVYLAPDGRHLGVSADGTVLLSLDAPLGGHRPAADFLFASAAAAYGAGTLGVVLTGMGRDGAGGARSIRERGGVVLAQDEASSVIYGMGRQAVEAGQVDQVLPLEQLGPALVARVEEGAEDAD